MSLTVISQSDDQQECGVFIVRNKISMNRSVFASRDSKTAVKVLLKSNEPESQENNQASVGSERDEKTFSLETLIAACSLLGSVC